MGTEIPEIVKPPFKVQEKCIFNPQIKLMLGISTNHKIMCIEMDEDYPRTYFIYNKGRSSLSGRATPRGTTTSTFIEVSPAKVRKEVIILE